MQAYNTVSETGEMSVFFNNDLAGPTLLNDLNKGLSTSGKTSLRTDFHDYRYLDEDAGTFDLSKYFVFEVQRGDEDSSSIEYLGFNVDSIGVKNDMVHFKLTFEHPLKVSIGSRKDFLKVTIKDESFFTSMRGDNSGLRLETGTEVLMLLPKMLPNQSYGSFLTLLETSLTSATEVICVI